MSEPREVETMVLRLNREPFLSLNRTSALRMDESFQHHWGVLGRHGITTLTQLGTLQVADKILPAPGITVPRPDLYMGQAPFSDAPLPTGEILSGVGNVVHVLPDSAISTSRVEVIEGQQVSVDVAYWAAQEIVIAAHSRIVLASAQSFLTLITRKLTVEDDVVLTWQRPGPTRIPLYTAIFDMSVRKPPKPEQRDASSRDNPEAGAPGFPAYPGQGGDRGAHAPWVELWLLELHGNPQIELPGQAGFPGGTGGDGGDGGDGSRGLPEEWSWGFCAKARGAGGPGGQPSVSGPGGPGGPGGHGGKFTLFAPEDVVDAWTTRGFYINTAGGAGGPGGEPGAPGVGGAGGPRGYGQICKPEREGGPDWLGGPPGDERHGPRGAWGPAGLPGGHYDESTRFVAIDAAEFEAKAIAPAIVTMEPLEAAAGDRVRALGARFASGDRFLIGGAPAEDVDVRSSTEATMTVPTGAIAGRAEVHLERPDGSRSNSATVTIAPTLTGPVEQGRLRPGSVVTIAGSGFPPSGHVDDHGVETVLSVRLNGSEMPEVEVVDPHTARFRVRRPPGIAAQETGEPATLTVDIGVAGVPESNAVQVVLDTLRVLVLGDSVMWGQGLQAHQKIHARVIAALRAREGDIGAYPRLLAHSGAIVGASGVTGEGVDPEVPWSYPTIRQQAQADVPDPESVDVVLVNGGINDIEVNRILSPGTSFTDLTARTESACFWAVRDLVTGLVGKFPNARVVALGYYPMVTAFSRAGSLDQLLGTHGVVLPVLPGDDVIERVVQRCRIFARRANAATLAAVDLVNASLPSPRVAFAVPDFEDDRAVFSDASWLWGFSGSGNPADGNVAIERRQACSLVYANDGTLRARCERASVGHPNPAGAQAFAAAALEALDALEGGHATPTQQPWPHNLLMGVAESTLQTHGGLDNDWTDAFSSAAWSKQSRDRVSGEDPHALYEPPGSAIGHEDLTVLAQDLDRLSELGVNAYRFSLEWSMLQPNRPADVNQVDDTDFDATALAHFRSFLDLLAVRGMTPVVTLNHFSLPKWVLTVPRTAVEYANPGSDFNQSLRGWAGPQTQAAWESYVDFCARSFPDVVYWLTLNEPVGSVLGLGYIGGVWPPGLLPIVDQDPKRVYFNMMRAHVRAYDILKAHLPHCKVGWAHAMLRVERAFGPSPLTGDHAASASQVDYVLNWHVLDALVQGRLDRAVAHRRGERDYASDQERDAELGSTGPWRPRMDFVGVNYYRRVYGFHFAPLAVTNAAWFGGKFSNNLAQSDEPHALLNELGWEINPDGLLEILKRIRADYDLPVMLTENGTPEARDAMRAPSLVAHMRALQGAREQAGVNVLGYLHWTGVDNWELGDGYAEAAKFGLYRVERGSSSNPRGERVLTEGGLAFAAVTAAGSADAGAALFGRVSADGELVELPTYSLTYRRGTRADGGSFELILLPARAGWWALLREAEGGGWRRAQAVAVGGGRLRVDAAPGRLYEGAFLGDTSSGECTDADGRVVGFVASRPMAAGTWQSAGGSPVIAVALNCWASGEGAWNGKLWSAFQGLPRCQPLTNAHIADTSVQLSAFRSLLLPPPMLDCGLSPDRLDGTLSGVGLSPTPWSARRLPEIPLS